VFKSQGFQILREVVPIEVAGFLEDYAKMRANVCADLEPFDNRLCWGTLHDKQMPGTWGCYADSASEVLLNGLLDAASDVSGVDLVPTYSYLRVYKPQDELTPHTDREECPVSATVNLGGDPWPIHIKDRAGGAHEVLLSAGDALVYAGEELEHWRHPFEGHSCTQVFLHYSSNANIAYDSRLGLGYPLDAGRFLKVIRS